MRKLTARDLDRLDRFLCGLDNDETMMLSMLDGFLSGIVVCPELILPSEWLPAIWGTDGPVFDNEREANEILGSIMARYNEIARSLGQKGKYRPILELDTDEVTLWEIWAEGFAAAMALRPESWGVYAATNDRETRSSFHCIASLAGMARDGKHLTTDVDEKVRRGAHRLIADCLETLHAVRLAMYPERRESQRQPDIGRNDPCPCGSGKKFKKCCLN